MHKYDYSFLESLPLPDNVSGLLDRLRHVVSSDFAHVTYTEAIALLEPHN